MANQFPASSPAPFGITTAQGGIIETSNSMNYSHEMKQLRNVGGDTTQLAFYDEKLEGTFSGFVPGTSPFTTSLASAVTLAVAPEDFFKGSVGGLTIVNTIGRTNSVEEYKAIEVGILHYPLVTA